MSKIKKSTKPKTVKKQTSRGNRIVESRYNSKTRLHCKHPFYKDSLR